MSTPVVMTASHFKSAWTTDRTVLCYFELTEQCSLHLFQPVSNETNCSCTL